MITVYLNEANFEYDIHSLVKAFYAREEVKVFADWDKILSLERETSPRFRLEISYQPGNCGMEDAIGISLLYPQADGEQAGFPTVRRKTEVNFADRKETKNRLKRCLYQMLSDYTGQRLPWGTLTGIRPVKIPMSMLEEGGEEAEIKAYLAEAYLVSEHKINLSMEIAKREMDLLQQVDYKDGYSLYIGIPFCPSICSYCSFSSSPVGIWKDKVGDYLDALDREIDFTANAMKGRKLNTVYIGGGTPTTLSPEQLKRLLTKISENFELSQLSEYTLEAGRPDSITCDKLKALREYGISRISINPQTMKQETLDLIGRRHTRQQTLDAFWMAREFGFDNINMDLILGLPGEGIEDVEATMEQIKELSPESITVHSLAIKRAARFQMFPEEYQGLSMENSWEMVDLTAKYARELGLFPYYLYRQKNMAGNFENVGYAKPGKEGIYNILMMEDRQSILALGAGASTKYVLAPQQGNIGVRVEHTENVKDISHYLQRVEEMIGRKRDGIRQYLQIVS